MHYFSEKKNQYTVYSKKSDISRGGTAICYHEANSMVVQLTRSENSPVISWEWTCDVHCSLHEPWDGQVQGRVPYDGVHQAASSSRSPPPTATTKQVEVQWTVFSHINRPSCSQTDPQAGKTWHYWLWVIACLRLVGSYSPKIWVTNRSRDVSNGMMGRGDLIRNGSSNQR